MVHLQENGFEVEDNVLSEGLSQIREEHHVPAGMHGCHMALVDGYVVEGHVPADALRRFLEEGSELTGIAVPGMPRGSPGMDEGDPANFDSYDVVTFDRDGKTSVFASY